MRALGIVDTPMGRSVGGNAFVRVRMGCDFFFRRPVWVMPAVAVEGLRGLRCVRVGPDWIMMDSPDGSQWSRPRLGLPSSVP